MLRLPPKSTPFPTRRSSDLLDRLVGLVLPLLGEGLVDLLIELARRVVRHVEQLDLRQRGPAAGDRKSTRLNSSHPSISYAVFCLKKKNNSSFGETAQSQYKA